LVDWLIGCSAGCLVSYLLR